MQILYCDKCGMRVAEKALADGTVVRSDDRVFCQACKPAPKAATVLRGGASRESSGALAATRTSASARGHGSRLSDAAASNSLILIAGAAAVLVVLALVFMLASSKEKTASATKSAKPQRSEEIGTAKTGVETSKSEPAKTTLPVPPSAQSPAAAITTAAPSAQPAPARDAEQLAGEAYQLLTRFENLVPNDKASRIQRIESFLIQHGETIVAARARRMLNELKEASKSSDPPAVVAASEPLKPVEAGAATPIPASPATPEPARLPAGREVSLDLNGVKLELILIAAGEFEMGDAVSKPVHKVSISRGFYLGKYPVTQAQYKKVMGQNPSHFKGADRPVEMVCYSDALDFCARAGKLTARAFRLPTEAEWEYACRAGTKTTFNLGDNEAALDQGAWFEINSGAQTHPVGKKKSNAWGLYDMHGNVWQWCLDWHADDYYAKSPAVDPQGPEQGNSRSLRGGSWFHGSWICRSARRYGDTPANRDNRIGFRVVVVAAKAP